MGVGLIGYGLAYCGEVNELCDGFARSLTPIIRISK